MAFLMARSGLCLLALAIALGAFGAHGLEFMVTDERLVTWETAVRYQAWLSLVLIGLGLSRLSQARWVFPLLVSGMCIFSGSLYLFVLLDLPILGAITPIGGVLMMIGLVLAAVSLKPQSELEYFRRSALATTLTEERAMAAPAIEGVSRPDMASGMHNRL